ncbi:MAG: 50S ribosomal protein L12 [Pseudonocardiales bacterium]|nr:MAG: 50S ribosomal protein L12 [Pseudonocardiales bacterium]
MDEEQLLARIADLERRLDWIYRATGYGAVSSGAASAQWPAVGGDALSAEILDLLGRGRKIEAIKVYRERTGVGLKEAKDAVERLG